MKYLWGILLAGLVLAGCKTADTGEFGKVSVVKEKEVVNEKTGQISLVTQRLDELAARSLSDKGSESLLTPQRIADVGMFFSSFDINDSKGILLAIPNAEGQSGTDLWIYRGGKIRLTKTVYDHGYPSFSHDGESVLFSSRRGKRVVGTYSQDSYVWRMKSSSAGGITRIGSPAFSYLYPRYSQDGEKILFSMISLFGNSPFIWAMEKNGALPTQLTQGQYPQWLDKETISFSNPDDNTGLFTIWTCKTDGAMLTQLISDNEADCIHPMPHPNGKFIAYVKQNPTAKSVEQSRDIYIYNLETGLSQQITTNASRDDLPHWSDDGNYLYFRSTRGVGWNVWRLPTQSLLE